MGARRPLLVGLLAGAILLLAPLAAGTARASTVVYQCGGAICAVDPEEASPQPRQVTADGRLAGLTRDGATVAWVEPSGALVKAPLAGGAPQTVYTGGVYSEPEMSPDGSAFLWWYPFDSGFGPATFVGELTAAGEWQGLGTCIGCTMTDGWLGATPLASFPVGATGDGSPSRICGLSPSGSASCAQPLVADARGDLYFPAGSPDGTEIVATLAAPPGTTNTAGGIALYSTASGGLVRDVTSGPGDTTPQFSPDGGSIVFERSGQIVTHDLATGAEKALGAGVYPFWGAASLPGSTQSPPPTAPPPTSSGHRRAPRLSLRIPHQTLRKVLRRRAIVVRCHLAAAGRCAVKATVTARTARRLGLKVPKKAKVRTLAKAARKLKKKGTAKLRLRLSRKDAAALRHKRSLKLKVTATSTAPGATPRRQVRKLTLRG